MVHVPTLYVDTLFLNCKFLEDYFPDPMLKVIHITTTSKMTTDFDTLLRAAKTILPEDAHSLTVTASYIKLADGSVPLVVVVSAFSTSTPAGQVRPLYLNSIRAALTTYEVDHSLTRDLTPLHGITSNITIGANGFVPKWGHACCYAPPVQVKELYQFHPSALALILSTFFNGTEPTLNPILLFHQADTAPTMLLITDGKIDDEQSGRAALRGQRNPPGKEAETIARSAALKSAEDRSATSSYPHHLDSLSFEELTELASTTRATADKLNDQRLNALIRVEDLRAIATQADTQTHTRTEIQNAQDALGAAIADHSTLMDESLSADNAAWEAAAALASATASLRSTNSSTDVPPTALPTPTGLEASSANQSQPTESKAGAIPATSG
jgi:hypothetical protein